MIKVNNISKSFGNKIIFNGFSLDIEQGEFVALIGKSGCGKSTLLNIMGLLENPDSGDIYINGEKSGNVGSNKVQKLIRNNINYLFQNFALIENKTVDYNLLLGLKFKKCNKKKKLELIDSTLKKLGLEGYGKRKVYTLSGGEQQRVALCRIILKDNNIILADEPTGSLDSENRDDVINILKELNNLGKTIIVVTHDDNVSKHASRVIKL